MVVETANPMDIFNEVGDLVVKVTHAESTAAAERPVFLTAWCAC